MSTNTEIKNIELPGSLTVRELAEMLGNTPIDIIKILMSNGVMANINQVIDFDTAAIVASELGFEATLKAIDQVEQEDKGEIALWKRLIADEPQAELRARPPVVTILGHVDHGKTTLLDAIRQTNVVEGEAGGITQHIGAYQVIHNGKTVTFLDTPGHAAFTAMRSRGAQGADIVILVVAADDGVMPQTREAYNHARAAKVPMVVAMNKIDRPNANPERVKQQLADMGLVPDDWDGDTMVVPVSAKQKQGIEDLLEAVQLVAENTQIQANPEGQVFGTVIEAERDKSRGVTATILVQNGTLRMGDTLVAGMTYGRIRAMFDHHGEAIEEAGPSAPVSVLGLSDVPTAGDLFRVVENDRAARGIVAEREEKAKETKEEAGRTRKLENVFNRFQSGEMRELRLIVKADVQGSLEPIVSSLKEIKGEDELGEIRVNVLHSATGNVVGDDVSLASASDAIVLGFSVDVDNAAARQAETEGVEIRTYDIIYRLTEDVEKALKGMLEPEDVEKVLGKAEVRQLFEIKKIGVIAGCRVTEGEIKRTARMRVVRGGEKVIFEGPISSLKHERDDVRDVRNGFECGIGIEGFTDFKIGDVLECFIIEKTAHK
ncbi:MAG: translation initiation factor IF-2 [Anaerolineae bacterium]|nr:MAG: translation initiation factor IF-2 [Anaerolineae bacterium]